MARWTPRIGPGLWMAATLAALCLVLWAATHEPLYAQLANVVLLTTLVGAAAWNVAGVLTQPADGRLGQVLGAAVLAWAMIVWQVWLLSIAGNLGGNLTPAGLWVASTVLCAAALWLRYRCQKKVPGTFFQGGTRAPIGRLTANGGAEKGSRNLFFGGAGWGAMGWGLLALSLGALGLRTATALLIPPQNWDSMSYHLYFPAQWIRHACVHVVPTPFGPEFLAYFPCNAELVWCWLMLPLRADLLARAGQVPFLLVAAAGVYGLARELGASARYAWLGPLLVLWCFVSQTQSVTSNNDVAVAAPFVTAFYFLMVYQRRRTRGTILLVGLCLGLFVGTKVSALVFVALPGLLGLGLVLRPGRVWRDRLVDLLMFAIGTVATGGYWYVRNWVLTGNPVFPARVELFGVEVFWGYLTRAGLEAGGWTTVSHTWTTLVSVIGHATGGPQLIVLVLGWLSAVVLWVARDRRPVSLYVLLMLPLVVAIFWFGIAYQTQGRYCLPGIYVGCVAVAYAAHKLGRWGWIATAAVIAAWTVAGLGTDWLHAVIGWPPPRVFGTFPLLRSPIAPGWGPWLQALLVGSLGAASLLVGLHAAGRPTGSHWVTWGWRCTWVVVLAVLGVGMVRGRFARVVAPERALDLVSFGNPGLGKPWQTDLYEAWRAVAGMGRRWAIKGVTGRLSIVYVGHNIPYYLMGPEYDNFVLPANVNWESGWLLHDYCNAYRRRGQPVPVTNDRTFVDRHEQDAQAWYHIIHNGGIDVVVMTRYHEGEIAYFAREAAQTNGFPIERQWADQRPDLFDLVFARAHARIYRVRPAGHTSARHRLASCLPGAYTGAP